MNRDNEKIQDDKIKEILALSKIKAGENLKYRIMQQIETESVLSVKKSKGRNLMPLIGNSVIIMGIMHALVIMVAIGFYFMGGVESLNSFTFFMPVIMISLVCSMFWMISIYDDKRRFKKADNNR